MRKVTLTLDAQEKYEVIKRLVDEHGNKQSAALKVTLTFWNTFD